MCVSHLAWPLLSPTHSNALTTAGCHRVKLMCDRQLRISPSITTVFTAKRIIISAKTNFSSCTAAHFELASAIFTLQIDNEAVPEATVRGNGSGRFEFRKDVYYRNPSNYGATNHDFSILALI